MDVLGKDIEAHFDAGIPFVAYRKPLEDGIHLVYQTDDQLHTSNILDQPSFVFAPFDPGRRMLLLLNTHRKMYRFSVAESTRSSASVSDVQRASHIALVEKGIAAIQKEKLQKVVLSRKEAVDTKKRPSTILKQLLSQYKKAFVYLFHHPKVGTWLGATPETLVKVTERDFETVSLAGTIHLQDSEDVVWGNKELEEQLVVTESIVNSLQDIATLNIGKLETVRAGELLHLKTKIKGTFSEKVVLDDLVGRLHPTPAVCGLPAAAARQFIFDHEGYDREFYTGFMGEVDPEGSTALYVNLRCMKWLPGKAEVFVGGGITKDSSPEAEWLETVNKSTTIKSVL